jgi:hypothetical protein
MGLGDGKGFMEKFQYFISLMDFIETQNQCHIDTAQITLDL